MPSARFRTQNWDGELFHIITTLVFYVPYLGLARTMYTYTVYMQYFWLGNHQIYGHIQCIYTVLANPNLTAAYDFHGSEHRCCVLVLLHVAGRECQCCVLDLWHVAGRECQCCVLVLLHVAGRECQCCVLDLWHVAGRECQCCAVLFVLHHDHCQLTRAV